MKRVNLSPFSHSLSISSFSLHFLILSRFPLHFLILSPFSCSPAARLPQVVQPCQDTAKKHDPSEQGEMGMRVKKGQKLTSKQLKMIESATKKRETSTNPLCKEKPRSMFRLFVHHTTRQKCNGLRHWVLLKLTEYAKIFSQLSRMRLKLIQN